MGSKNLAGSRAAGLLHLVRVGKGPLSSSIQRVVPIRQFPQLRRQLIRRPIRQSSPPLELLNHPNALDPVGSRLHQFPNWRGGWAAWARCCRRSPT